MKDSIYHQNSIEEDKDENRMSRGGEIISIYTDSLEETEIEDLATIKDGTLLMFDDSSSAINNLLPMTAEAQGKIYNFQSLQKILDEKEPFETKLYLALNNNFSNIPEVKVSFFEKIGFGNSKKSKQLVEAAVQGWDETECNLKEAMRNNDELKQKVEALQTERRKSNNEYAILQASVKGVLSTLNEEKFIFNNKVKALDNLISDASKTRSELFGKCRELKKYYYKKTESLKEVVETWNMNINELRVSLLTVLEKRIIAEKKTERNSNILKELKELEYLKFHRKEQIDFSLDMIVRAMNYFAESKEHEGFNVRNMQRGFREALRRIKEASFEAIEANTAFKVQATKDPRELLPYTRVSDSSPCRRTDKIVLNSKGHQSIYERHE